MDTDSIYCKSTASGANNREEHFNDRGERFNIFKEGRAFEKCLLHEISLIIVIITTAIFIKKPAKK